MDGTVGSVEPLGFRNRRGLACLKGDPGREADSGTDAID